MYLLFSPQTPQIPHPNPLLPYITTNSPIQLNRPKTLNAFGDNLGDEVITAFRELNEHPDTIFTVLTGKGRFFSSGADVRGGIPTATGAGGNQTDAGKKIASINKFAATLEMMRSAIDHKKVLILALNGPSVGGGAAWFQGVSDIVLAASGAWLQVPFSALGLVPENGSVTTYAQSIGQHRANEFLMFGRKVSVEEMERWGMVNHVFPAEGFHEKVIEYLEEQLEVNDGKAMLETKRLANIPLRETRINALFNSWEALSERSVDGASAARFEAKRKNLESKSKSRL
ncbi:ClpP/crotonase [Microthyrium microscopicum]|uniref:ClpP/crotonase n=1 Tax=Microthyrium microscopicum TaxID=703497 RepID=A0A6A6U720_9PEZI|nr:ClpP/crotonase [Microthyrium microscopicum]